MQSRIKNIITNRKFKRGFGLSILIFIIVWWFSIPKNLFPQSYSQLVFAENGNLLGARIAKDEQWRFPVCDSIPFKFKTAIIYFEDEYFEYHPGVNPVSIFRALKNNASGGKVTSGGSTLTMQVIRLSRNNPPRTYWEKCKEIFKATRLETTYSKDSILSMYAAHAPFGGNVVGLDAAAWRYFGKLPHQLSWGEAATLAVLPNAPALIFPGKNQSALKKKRDRLLKKLFEKGELNGENYELAIAEPLPQKPYSLPNSAPHFIAYTAKRYPNSRIQSTIDYDLQERVNRIVESHHQTLAQREIHNISVIISEVESGEVKAYVGNTADAQKQNQNDVDINQAMRSSGSILKPILYANMLDQGELFPTTLLSDIPSDITENFSHEYQGVVPANEALIQSLNIPAIQMLRMHGVSNFHAELKQLGFSTLNFPSSHYGLSLIVGGAEISPWDLNNAYRKMAYKLNGGKDDYFKDLKIFKNEEGEIDKSPKLSEQSIYLTFNELRKLARPSSESGWRVFGNNSIAWKTGTSHGFKDAWSVGVTSNYIITVWVGNADGEGRPENVGVKAAAPILFDIYDILPKTDWFGAPDNFYKTTVCADSGYNVGENCPYTLEVTTPTADNKVGRCPYHQKIFLDETGQYRVNATCYPVEKMQAKIFFTLPAIEERYYQSQHPWYQSLPDFLEGCETTDSNSMNFIYPRNFTQIFLPKDNEGKVQPMIVKVSHKNKSAVLTWLLDNKYLTQTSEFHEYALQTNYGKHKLTISDQYGNSIEKSFSIASKN